MVRVKIKKRRYIYALIITLIIFISGILLSLLVSEERVDYMQQDNKLQKLNYESLQLQFLFLNELEETKGCSAASKTLENNLIELENMRERVERYEEETFSGTGKDFKFLRREYTLTQIRYWLLTKKAKEICPMDSVSILYFYGKECPECGTQGTILTYLKEKLKKQLLIFALDAGFKEEAMIEIVKTNYNINKVPTLVINEKTYEGLQDMDEILEIICPTLKETPEICQEYIN